MKRTSRELKALAREALKGHYGTLIGATVLLGIFSGILEMIPQMIIRNANTPIALMLQFVVSVIVGVLTYLLQLGVVAMILHMIRGQYFGVGELVYAFQHHPDRFIIVGIIEIGISTVLQLPATICMYNVQPGDIGRVMLGTLLLLAGSIISIIILLGFALCEMLLIDNDDLGAIDAVRQSFALMSGNKGRLFYIQLSFFGLALLTILSCGIGMLWLMPYMLTTEVFFYMEVCGELDHPYYGETNMDGDGGSNGYTNYDGSNGHTDSYGNHYTNGSNPYDNRYSYGSDTYDNRYSNSSDSYDNRYNSDSESSGGGSSNAYNYGQSGDYDDYNTEA